METFLHWLFVCKLKVRRLIRWTNDVTWTDVSKHRDTGHQPTPLLEGTGMEVQPVHWAGQQEHEDPSAALLILNSGTRKNRFSATKEK